MMHVGRRADTAVDSPKRRCLRGSWPGGALDSQAFNFVQLDAVWGIVVRWP